MTGVGNKMMELVKALATKPVDPSVIDPRDPHGKKKKTNSHRLFSDSQMCDMTSLC